MRRTLCILFALVAGLFAPAHAATVAYVSSSAVIQHEGLDLEVRFSVSKPGSYSTPMATAVRPTLSNGSRTITLEPLGVSWSDVSTTLDWSVFYAIPPPDRVLYTESSNWVLGWTGGALFADSDGNATATSASNLAVTSLSRVDANGWTAYTQTRAAKYYIAANGSDGANGTSEGTAWRTVNRAKQALVNGQHIEFAFRRGDTWNEGFGRVQASGESATKPILITYYGASGNPPLFSLPAGTAFLNSYGAAVNHWAVVGVDIDGNTNYAIDWKAPTSGVRFEGCRVYDAHTAFTLEIDGALIGNTYASTGVDNFNLYRCVVIDSHTAGHSHGVYAFDARGFRAVECIFDHNGWIGGTTPSDQNHNFYFHAHTEGWRILRTLSLRSAGNGWSMNCPGWASQSYVYAANSACQQRGDVMTTGPFPSTSGLARVVVEGGANSTNNGNASEPRSLALGIHFNQHWTESRSEWPGFAPTPGPQTATNCAVIQKLSNVTGDAAAYVVESYNGAGTPRKFGIINCVAYRWRDRDIAVIGQNDQLEVRNSAFVEDNSTQPRGHLFAAYANSLNATLLKFSGNSYFSSSNPNTQWFGHSEGFSSISQATWAAFETGETFAAPAWDAPTRNLASYHASIGGVQTAQAFIDAARAMNRFTWDDRYTGKAVTDYVLAGFATGGGTTPGSAPNPPTNVRFTGKTSTTLTLALDPALTGDPADSYTFQRMSGASVAASYASSTPAASATSLTGSTNYTFRAIATNSFGNSTPSGEVVIRTAPAAVSGLSLSAQPNAVKALWDASTDDEFDAYRVFWSLVGSSGPWTHSFTTTATDFTISTTAPVWVYVVQIDKSGAISDASGVETETPDAVTEAPSAPGTIVLGATSGQIRIDWPDVTDAVTYTVKIGTSTGTYPITFDRSVSDATFSAVVPGRRYYVTVVATNAAGSSANASEVSVVVPTPPRRRLGFGIWWWSWMVNTIKVAA